MKAAHQLPCSAV